VLFHLFATERSRNGVDSSQRNLKNKCHSYISDGVIEQPLPLDKEHALHRPTNILIIFTVEYTVNSYQVTAALKS